MAFGDWDTAIGSLVVAYGMFAIPDLRAPGDPAAVSVFGDPRFAIETAPVGDGVAVRFAAEAIMASGPTGFVVAAPGQELPANGAGEALIGTARLAAFDAGAGPGTVTMAAAPVTPPAIAAESVLTLAPIPAVATLDTELVILAGPTEQTQIQAPGVPALVQGTGIFVGSAAPIAWTAAADVSTVPFGDGDWEVSVGPLDTFYGDFANPALAGFDNAEAIGVYGDPAGTIDSAQAADNIAIQFASEVPAGNSYLLSAPGGTLISGSIDETGPYTFVFAAFDNGVPVSTVGWTFAVETPSGGAPRWSYSIDPLTGTVTVTTIDASVSGVDAVIVATTDAPITTLSVTAATIPVDAWSLSIAPELSCYAAGTRIATEQGEMPIEDIAVGTRVRTLDGAEPVRWIGRHRVDCRARRDLAPVRVKAHAFGPGEPRRDLLLSPDHAIFAADALVPIKYLINGTTIAPVPLDEIPGGAVVYHHLELDRHGVILAEGLAAESYLDVGNKAGIADANPLLAPLIWEARGYAPLLVTGPTVDALRAALQRRAGAALVA
jgi:hypothetical protein